MNFHPFRFLALIVLLLTAPSGVIPNARADPWPNTGVH
jgi:hypothetical protein